MDGEEFYLWFKQSLDQLGVGFHGKDLIQVSGDLSLTVSDRGSRTTVELNTEEFDESTKASHD